MQDKASEQKLRKWMLLLFILLELLPGSLQHATDNSTRQKRHITFPESNGVSNSRTCYTQDRREGSCIRITECRELRNVNYNHLRPFFCGFSEQEPLVCCPLVNLSGGGNTRPPVRPPTRNTRHPTRPTRTTRTTRRPTGPPIDTRLTVERGRPTFLPTECGRSPYPKRSLIGLREAEKGSWPWMAVVYVRRRGRRNPDCGGALVTSQHVITAAHCVVSGSRSQTLAADDMSVRLGEHDLYSDDDGMNPEDYDVSEVIRHENYNPRTYENDIAVLRLSRSAQSQPNVSAICLPYDSLRNQDLSLKKAFVAGWGMESFNGASSAVLREDAFDIQNQSFCREAFRNELPINDNYLCAGNLYGTKDSCLGDSGGPLMCAGKDGDNRFFLFFLMGIFSSGIKCATPGYPGVYTRVTRYLDWLRPHLSS